jgi:hypothetical protein
MNTQKINASIKNAQDTVKRLWNENPVIVIVLGIAAANAGAKVMQANTDRKREKSWRREVSRREKNDKTKS